MAHRFIVSHRALRPTTSVKKKISSIQPLLFYFQKRNWKFYRLSTDSFSHLATHNYPTNFDF